MDICGGPFEPSHRDTELSYLVGEVFLNAGAGENHDADRQNVEHLVFALERLLRSVLKSFEQLRERFVVVVLCARDGGV